MFSLNFVPNNTEIKSNSILNSNTRSKKNSKDFLQILEGQRDNVKKFNKEVTISDVKEEHKTTNTIEKQKSIVKEDKLEELEELDINQEEMKIIMILQSLFALYSLLEELDIESNKLKETVFELIEIEIGETLNLLEELLNKESTLNEEFLPETIENIEQFMESLETEIEEYKELIDMGIELPIEKSLYQLKEGIANLKDFVRKNSNSSLENQIKLEDNFGQNLNVVEDMPTEVEHAKKENLSDKKEDVEADVFKEENIEIEENQIPNFEMKTQVIQKETYVPEMEKTQNIEQPKIVEQIVDKAKLIVDDFKQEIKISLKPEILGDVVLKMEAVKGSITTKIMVDNHRTKELIEANLYQLKEEMKENGLEIKTFEVFVGSNEDFQKEKSQDFFQNKKSKKIKIKDEEIDEIKKYDENVFQEVDSVYNVYGESKLNLFA